MNQVNLINLGRCRKFLRIGTSRRYLLEVISFDIGGDILRKLTEDRRNRSAEFC